MSASIHVAWLLATADKPVHGPSWSHEDKLTEEEFLKFGITSWENHPGKRSDWRSTFLGPQFFSSAEVGRKESEKWKMWLLSRRQRLVVSRPLNPDSKRTSVIRGRLVPARMLQLHSSGCYCCTLSALRPCRITGFDLMIRPPVMESQLEGASLIFPKDVFFWSGKQ